jgi:DNA-binding GntR family transcriptional regulator
MTGRDAVTLAEARPGTIVETICRSLSDEIVDGLLKPGDRLDEMGLAERFGVSRTPVREALRRLEATGMVQRRPNRGVVVATLSGRQLAEMFEAMAEVEAACARLAAERMSARERGALRDLHDRSAALAAERDEPRYEETNRRLHAAIYAGAGNAEIAALALALRARVAPFRRAQFRVPGRLASSFAEHGAVVAAILAGDGEAAERAMRRHILTVADASETVRAAPAAPGRAAG